MILVLPAMRLDTDKDDFLLVGDDQRMKQAAEGFPIALNSLQAKRFRQARHSWLPASKAYKESTVDWTAL